MSMALTEKAPSRSRWVFDLPVTVTLFKVMVSLVRLPFLLGVWASTYRYDRQTINKNSLLIIIARNSLYSALFPRLSFRLFSDMAGFLALSEKSAFPNLSVAFLDFS